MDEAPEPSYAELEAISVPGWIAWAERASGWRRGMVALVVAPLYPVVCLLLGSEDAANARAIGRGSELERAGRPAEAMRAYLDECARLRVNERRGWVSSYWLPLSLAARSALESTDDEKDLFLAEVARAPEPFQGRFAADTAECVSRMKHERQMAAQAVHWARVAVEADPTHPGPRRWQSWLARRESG